MILVYIGVIHFPQTNMETQIAPFKGTVILIGTLLGFHVSFRECIGFVAINILNLDLLETLVSFTGAIKGEVGML